MLRRIVKKLRNLGGSFHCPICQSAVRRFDPLPKEFTQQVVAHGFAVPLSSMETLNVDAYLCPVCGESDRSRLYAAYLTRVGLVSGTRFLDVAPSIALSRWIAGHPSIAYRSVDIASPLAMDRADLCHLPYPDQSFDVILCSHVLEHVEDPAKALAELRRILAPGGFGIVMVPIATGLSETLEGGIAMSEAERWKRFGQGDHLRLHAKSGFVAELIRAGFDVDQLNASQAVGDSVRIGVTPQSVLYVVRVSDQAPRKE